MLPLPTPMPLFLVSRVFLLNTMTLLMSLVKPRALNYLCIVILISRLTLRMAPLLLSHIMHLHCPIQHGQMKLTIAVLHDHIMYLLCPVLHGHLKVKIGRVSRASGR